MKDVPSEIIDAMVKDMSRPDFYGQGITTTYVVERIKHLQDGNRPQNGPDMFIQEWLKKGGYL